MPLVVSKQSTGRAPRPGNRWFTEKTIMGKSKGQSVITFVQIHGSRTPGQKLQMIPMTSPKSSHDSSHIERDRVVEFVPNLHAPWSLKVRIWEWQKKLITRFFPFSLARDGSSERLGIQRRINTPPSTNNILLPSHEIRPTLNHANFGFTKNIEFSVLEIYAWIKWTWLSHRTFLRYSDC